MEPAHFLPLVPGKLVLTWNKRRIMWCVHVYSLSTSCFICTSAHAKGEFALFSFSKVFYLWWFIEYCKLRVSICLHPCFNNNILVDSWDFLKKKNLGKSVALLLVFFCGRDCIVASHFYTLYAPFIHLSLNILYSSATTRTKLIIMYVNNLMGAKESIYYIGDEDDGTSSWVACWRICGLFSHEKLGSSAVKRDH